MKIWNTPARTGFLVALTLVLSGCAAQTATPPTERMLGTPAHVGGDVVYSFADLDATGAPTSVGVIFPARTLATLPTMHSDGHHCYDQNDDGTTDLATECFASHEWVLPLPSDVARRADMPFKWVLLNWNPAGHVPPGVYDLPHFDVHFYIQPIEDVFAIAPGPCGPDFVRCDQFELGKKPPPPNYMHPDFQNADAVVPAMGNHLIDLTSPEFQGETFTRTWIYGTYDGHVTFYEEMLTKDFMLSRPNTCFPIKTPAAVGLSGYYPTQSCTRYDAEADAYSVSMEGFVLREVSPPDPIVENNQSADSPDTTG